MKLASSSEERKTILAYVVVCILWGSTYLAIRIGVSEVPPALFAGLRYLIAGILVLGYAKIKKLEFPKNKKDIGRQALVGILILVGGNGFIVWASQWVHSGTASILAATIPLFMALLEFLLPMNTNIGIKGWIGLIVGFSGVVFLVLSNSSSGAVDFLGALIILMGAFFWATGSVYSKTFQATGATVSNIGIQMFAAGILLNTVGLILGEGNRLQLTSKGILSILYLVIFGSIIAYSCYVYILQKWPAAKVGTYAYVNPPVAVLLGSLVLKEAFSIEIIISTVVILAGVFLVQTAKVKTSVEKSQG